MRTYQNGHHGKQSYRFFRFGEEPIHPLEVPIAVHSQWDTMDFHERVNAAEFWIEFVTAGEIIFTQDTQTYTILPGMLFLARPGTTHHFSVGKKGFACKRSICLQGLCLETTLHSPAA